MYRNYINIPYNLPKYGSENQSLLFPSLKVTILNSSFLYSGNYSIKSFLNLINSSIVKLSIFNGQVKVLFFMLLIFYTNI